MERLHTEMRTAGALPGEIEDALADRPDAVPDADVRAPSAPHGEL